MIGPMDRHLPEDAAVAALLADYPPSMRTEARWFRELVHASLPDAIERVRAGWRIIGYDVPAGPRRTRYVAWIMVEREHVHLGFPHGVLMQDPDGLMEGRGITKRARWITAVPGRRPRQADVADLLLEAVRAATLSRAELALLQSDAIDRSAPAG